MTWQTFLFLVVAGSAFGYSGYRLSLLYKMMAAHQGKGPKLNQIKKRILVSIINVLGQKAVLEKRAAGIMHATIFWGFIIISLGTLEQFCGTLYRGANFEFIGHIPYLVLVFLQDFFNVAVLAGVAYAAYRRYFLRPPELGKSRDATIILALTALLMFSILLMNGFTILGASPWFQSAMPVSKWIAQYLSLFGLSSEANFNFGILFKWIHMLIVLGFAVYVPSSKHLHILAAGPNTFLKTLNREKGMKPINFEDEKIQQYGAAKVSDLSWKDALDYYSCTECGRCQEVCPASNTQKPLSPKRLILDLKNNMYRNQKALLAEDYNAITPVIDEEVTEDVIWACTTCRACEVVCPVFIEHTDKIYEIRRNLVMMESKFPAEVQTVFKNMETNYTPWAFSASDRAKWADGLSIPTLAEDPDVEVLLWVGCAGAYDERNKKVVRAVASLLKKAGVRFAILGTEEQCTGDSARRIGNEYLFQTLAKTNIETLNRYKVKKILSSCPHCFNTIKNEYPAFGGNYEVIHHSQYIAQLVSEGKLKPSKGLDETITFHDSCYMGRWNKVYNEPRQVLESIPSARLVEMSSHHEKSMCCGAGGGRMWMEEKIGTRINITRTEQALATRADIVASSCPFCMIMLSDGVKSKEMQDKVKVMDIAELMDQATL
jgi:Fe-S oxidoreductase